MHFRGNRELLSDSLKWVGRDESGGKPRRKKGQRGYAALAHAAILEEFFRPHDFSVQRAGNQRVALDLAGFGVGDGDVIHFQRAS